ncbi:MAG TPA: GNAT family N-acetyltransferase [Prolixibacteraceae bacterium]
MVELITLTNPDELNIEFRRIYEEAFPPEERRDWSQIVELLINPQFCFNGIYFQQKIVGFYTIWNLGEFNFMEHFAILDSERGKGIGSQVFQQIFKLNSTQLILEVEEPFTRSAQKRIEFYERLNFVVSEGVYYQPPYSIGKNKVKMLLMSNPERILPDDFAAIQSRIYDVVYQCIL